MDVFVLGGTGLIGRRLVERLVARGDRVAVLTRQARQGSVVEFLTGDPAVPGPWCARLAAADAVVNLAGEPILGGRWTPKRKELLGKSRIAATLNAVQALDGRTKTFVSGSAIGYYGFGGDEAFDEASPAGTDFLAQLCARWEDAAQGAAARGARVVTLRTGLVLDAGGGALKPMAAAFRLGLGGPIAGGAQWVSWIHAADETGLILHALDAARVAGPLNATAPEPVTNRGLTEALAHAVHRPAFLPMPGWAPRLAIGEGAALATRGQRVLPAKALATGYAFQFPTLPAALKDLL